MEKLTMNFTNARQFFESLPPAPSLTLQERVQQEVERFNAKEGEMTDDIDCPICKNKQLIYVPDKNGTSVMSRECECKKRHESLRLARQSGMNALLKCTFEGFKATEPWQIRMLTAAKAFAEHPDGWFYISGQSGCGKTHLASAICNELMKKNRLVRRMSWLTESERLKSLRNTPDYQALIDRFKKCEVLYIDDFFKVQKGSNPTAADVKLAFELLDTRMVNEKITIITSELFAADVVGIDEAVGGRIMEMTTGGNRICIERDTKRNYRLHM